jgi:hypothetical protein
MNRRLEYGYSFKYVKGLVNKEKVNIGVECIETGEFLPFHYTTILHN